MIQVSDINTEMLSLNKTDSVVEFGQVVKASANMPIAYVNNVRIFAQDDNGNLYSVQRDSLQALTAKQRQSVRALDIQDLFSRSHWVAVLGKRESVRVSKYWRGLTGKELFA